MAVKYRKSVREWIFDSANYILLSAVMLMMLYPCYYVLVASVSDPVKIYNSGGLIFYPQGFAMYSYKEVLKSLQIWTGYKNTIIYVLSGGFLSVLLTVSAGKPNSSP